MYEVLLEPHAVRQLDGIKDEDAYNRIVQALEKLSATPRPYGVAKLQENIYRIRVGRFRIIYAIEDEDKVVLISQILPRTERTYRKPR